MENDLRDGLKLLILQEGRFWPSRLNSTQLPDVYGIVMEKQRGNRPQILPRDDILKEAVRYQTKNVPYKSPIIQFYRFSRSSLKINPNFPLEPEFVCIGVVLTIASFLAPLKTSRMWYLTRIIWFKSSWTMVIADKWN